MAATPPQPHVAFFPCAGMGHLLPFLRLAAVFASRGCTVTIITPNPAVSAAESDNLSTFFSTHPHIKRLQFHLLPYKPSNLTNEDPFFIQMESISNSLHLLPPLLSSLTPSLSAIVADFPVFARVAQIASDLSISTYTLIVTSARFFSLMNYLPHLPQNLPQPYIEPPGLDPVPLSSIPPVMLNLNHFFAATIVSNVSSLHKAKGIFINTFNSLEPEAIQALRSSVAAPILPVGPLESFDSNPADNSLPWLDEQSPESVLYICFGSRSALSKDQIKELAAGLEKSGLQFLWTLKTSKVDKEDKEGVEEILGEAFLERTKKQGIVVKRWVKQEVILAHPAVGGFVSHCGWNSVVETAALGVPVLAWPQHGDSRVNAEVVEKAGLGVWVREWGWGGEKVVGRDEIAEKMRELMVGKEWRARAKEVMEEARKARGTDGSSESLLRGVLDSLKK